ncbi:MAG: SsrA-binding protein SmpB [Candidatus Gastranaerophilales bacterium]|nr:SsrA-binding protein SmpB [Candidatus Gastranaerophilales bacterium]
MANDKKNIKTQGNKLISSNKKAHFDYLLFDKFEAGIALLGTEIKSIRRNGANLKDSYIKITDNLEAYLINCHISPYEFGNIYNHEPRRERKLLLNKKEILKILNKIKQEKYTLVPTQMYFSSRWVKLEIALAKGKKLYDKRDSLKKKDIERDIKRLG